MKTQITAFSEFGISAYNAPGVGDFISLTQMAISQGGVDLLNEWLKNKNTIEFLEVWEKLNNPSFNDQACKTILMEAGVNRFRLPVKKWVSETGAIGIVAKAGRYGGTFAHLDIALEFAGWLSPQLRLYIIAEFKRFKQQESAKAEHQLEWSVQRLLSKTAYRVHTDAVKEMLAPDPSRASKLVYASEADILNIAVFGQTAAEFKRDNPDAKGNMREFASIDQLLVLTQMESQNALLVKQGVSKEERLAYLQKEAARQLESLKDHPFINSATPKKLPS